MPTLCDPHVLVLFIFKRMAAQPPNSHDLSLQEPARLPAGPPDTAGWLRACTLLLCQLPWAHLPQLGADQAKAAVLVPVSRLLRLAVRHLAANSADSQASMTVVVQVPAHHLTACSCTAQHVSMTKVLQVPLEHLNP